MSVIKSSKAEQDIRVTAVWYLERDPDNPGLSHRFLWALENQLSRLEGMPGIGPLWEAEDPRLRGLRYHSVRGFESYLVFYFPTDEGIDVSRVLHTARDLPNLLKEEP